MKRAFPPRFWMTSAVLLCGIAIFFALISVKEAQAGDETARVLANARQLHLAITMMSLDLKSSGESPKGGLPADIGVTSAREYLRRLVADNYLSAAAAAKIGFPGEITIANVSSTDSPDTALVVSTWLAHPERPHPKGFVVFSFGGSGGIYKRPADATSPNALKLPPRTPPILMDE